MAAAIELGPAGIRVNSVHPGIMDTPLLSAEGRKRVEQVVSMQPIPRLGRPEEGAALVLFARSMPRRRARQLTSELLRELGHEEQEWIVAEIRPDDVYEASYLSAPVFDGAGQIIVTLGLIIGVGVTLTGSQLLERAARLVEATERITEAIGGHFPATSSAAADRSRSGAAQRARTSTSVSRGDARRKR